jgi:DNA invertase Pin-like site-specific DNA recombinase
MDLDCIVVSPVAKVVIVAFETKQSIFDHNLKAIWEKILFQLIEAYAEFEKNMIREREESNEFARPSQRKTPGAQAKAHKSQKEATLSFGVSGQHLTMP